MNLRRQKDDWDRFRGALLLEQAADGAALVFDLRKAPMMFGYVFDPTALFGPAWYLTNAAVVRGIKRLGRAIDNGVVHAAMPSSRKRGCMSRRRRW